MATAVHPVVIGSYEALDVHLHDAKKDPDDPSGNVDLTGITLISARAKNPATGTVKDITCAVNGAAMNGNFRLTPDVNTWGEVGTFDLQISYTDGAGHKRIYPSEGNQLKVKVSGAN